MLPLERLRNAHGDAFELDGLIRAGSTRVQGARLMCSGLPFEQWNAATLVGLPVDLDAARRWYAERDCPFGMAVPEEYDFAPGDYLFSRSCMGLLPSAFAPAALPSGITLREATGADLEAFCAVDLDVFGGTLEHTRDWIEPSFGNGAFRHWIAEANAQPVAIGSARRTDADAGPCGTLTGIGVSETFRRLGIGAALTSRAAQWLIDTGATLVHLDPDDERAARVYRRLGFQEAPGFRIYRMTSGSRNI